MTAVPTTEFNFELPRGYVDAAGVVHRKGTMRMAMVRDELAAYYDKRVENDPSYAGAVLLSLVVIRLGTVADIHADVIKSLPTADLSYLQDMYNRVNAVSEDDAREAKQSADGFDFELPHGYLDSSGVLHRSGTMRKATAGDEILVWRHWRVKAEPAYLPVVLLSRVVTRLGTLTDIPASMFERAYTADYEYLQMLYNQINSPDFDSGS